MREIADNTTVKFYNDKIEYNKFDSEKFLREIGDEIKEVDHFLEKVMKEKVADNTQNTAN